MSETSSAISTELNRYYGKIGSSGIILCKSNVKVIDHETSKELTYGEIGELCFSGPGLMLKYYKNIEETRTAIFEDSSGVRWLHSGDLGYVDEDGFVFVTGRIKRIYSTRAEKNGTLYKLFPDYVAKVITEVPGVKDCADVCIDDTDYKNIAVAFIVLSENIDENRFKITVMKHLENTLPSHCIPKRIYYQSALPMTPIGKVDYCILEQLAQKVK